VVLPESRCDGDGCVSMWFEELGEAVVCEATSLWEAIHAFLNLHVDKAVVDELGELLFVHDGVGDDGDGNAHVGIVLRFHGRV
jgi:hypothetical protein